MSALPKFITTLPLCPGGSGGAVDGGDRGGGGSVRWTGGVSARAPIDDGGRVAGGTDVLGAARADGMGAGNGVDEVGKRRGGLAHAVRSASRTRTTMLLSFTSL